jgi:hypothetical protein
MDTSSRSYQASRGSDPIRHLDHPCPLDVVAGDDPAESLGRAYLTGWLLGGTGPIATYRLVIGGDELPGLFVCVGRQFAPVAV